MTTADSMGASSGISIASALQLSRERRIPESIAQARALLESCSEGERPSVESLCAILEWRAAHDVGRVNEGLAAALEAFKQLESAGYRPLLAWVFSGVGLALALIGDYESGLEWCQRGIEGAELSHDRHQLIVATCNKGIVFGYANDLPQAVEHFEWALRLCGDEPEVTAVMALSNISYCRILEAERGETGEAERHALAEDALRYAEQALARADAIPNADAHLAIHARGEATSNKATALRLLGRLDEAEAAYRAGLALSVPYLQTDVELAVGLAGLLVDAGRDDEAATLLQRAEAKARAEVVDQSLDRILDLRIVLARRAGRTAEADRLWESRLTLREKRYRDRLQKVRHYEKILARAEQLSAELDLSRNELELLQQKFELTTRLQEEQLLRERDRSRMEERMRLLRDMHDGFGSQLASARILLERGELSQEVLRQTLEECLADLHLVVDVLGQDDLSLDGALADFRFRIQRRLDALPVRVTWSVDLEDVPWMPRKMILEILRIVQEALSNALRHAKASVIRIEGHRPPDGDLVFRIVDDGVGLPPAVAGGRGMMNMRRRAEDISGQLDFLPGNPGTIVSLVVPCCSFSPTLAGMREEGAS